MSTVMETKSRKASTGDQMIRVKFTIEEREAFDHFVRERGFQKGVFAKRAILQEMARENRNGLEVTR